MSKPLSLLIRRPAYPHHKRAQGVEIAAEKWASLGRLNAIMAQRFVCQVTHAAPTAPPKPCNSKCIHFQMCISKIVQ